MQLLQNTPVQSSVKQFSSVLGCRLSFVLIKKQLHQRYFLEIFEDGIIATKKYLMIRFLVVTYDTSKNRLVDKRCPSGYCEKYYVQKIKLWSSILVKRTLSLDLLWVGVWKYEKRSLLKSFCWRCSDGVLHFQNSCQTLRNSLCLSLFYSKLAGFFSKAVDDFIYIIIFLTAAQS